MPLYEASTTVTIAEYAGMPRPAITCDLRESHLTAGETGPRDAE
jgi:hypothetical protein